MTRTSLYFGIILAIVGIVLAAEVSNVEKLSTTNIDEKISTDTWFIEFYAPWCGFCQRLAPLWEELATDLKNTNVHVASVNCDEHRMLCRRFGFDGFPTIMLVSDEQLYTYEGDRALAQFKAYAEGGFRDTTPVPLPVGNSWYDPILEVAESVVIDLIALYTESFVAGCIIAAITVFVAILGSLVVLPYFVGFKPSFIIPRTIYLLHKGQNRIVRVHPHDAAKFKTD